MIRADAGVAIGSGHVRRCLVLRDRLAARGWATAFASAPESLEAVPALRRGVGFEPVAGGDGRILDRLRRAWPQGVDLLVVDGYGIGRAFEAAARPWAKRILVIDDLADRGHDCDMLLDANYGRRPSDYADLVSRNCRLLLGPCYGLLRAEFRAERAQALARRRLRRGVSRVFVSLGGIDPANATPLALKALAAAGYRREAEVVLGSAAPGLSQVCRLLPRLPFRARLHLDSDRVAALMADCDLAIGAGGTMTWERFCLGLPSIVIPIAENQLPASRALTRDGQALVTAPIWALRPRDLAALVSRALSAHKLRDRLQARNARCVDGVGAARVVAEVERLVGGVRASRMPWFPGAKHDQGR